ncbi:hypothetical protein CY34DRAFT_101793 [Suillus luteus UH-Slu-Lm8-n1]|uniref:Uncharacterized protein n=1 Tax=Suillus luteus UH-Slu-Lm8-n1 TaxID=930992 RepID=A0A0C9ZSN2_9AGAM|nr:hypothetical protein CY34DRAFT_101793 [Suillus luteus UH-Slu-Lm8-n1]
MHFHYLMQSPLIDDSNLTCISAALDEFHANKHVIITAGVRWGKGNMTINNWYIPKLELMQNIVPSIGSSGVNTQWLKKCLNIYVFSCNCFSVSRGVGL